jgi:simple sugar transport system permease protein
MTPPVERLARVHVSGSGLLIAIVAVTIPVMVASALVVVVGADPLAAFWAYFIEPLTRPTSALEVLVSATPILLTGAAVAIAFRAGFWNIGAEGQLLAGAIAAAAAGQLVGDLPVPIATGALVLAAALAGAAWILVPALLRVQLGIDEVVTTLLLNPVALLLVDGLVHGPWRDPVSGLPQSPRIADSAILPDLLARSRVNGGFLLALGVIAVAWLVFARTTTGLRVRAVGLSPHAARFAGIEVERTLLRVALVSGAIAGVAGAVLVSGIAHRLTSGVAAGYGYTGIVVAMLGGLTMPGVALAGLVLGDLDVGASSAARSLGIPTPLGTVVQGLLLLTTVALLALRRWRIARAAPPPDEAEPEPTEPAEGAPVEAVPA